MVATISAAADQYHHSVNTLKYADRAKEIKTHVVQNVGSVERHVADYKSIIDNLQSEVQQLRGMLADRAPVPASLSAGSAAAAGAPGGAGSASASSAASPGVSSLEADALAWIDGLVQEVNDNIEERINLQKALFELEDINVCNQYELQNLEDMLCSTGGCRGLI
jgi:kinesin family protein 18/19